MKKIKVLFFTIFLFIYGYGIAQNYADKNYYLLDSLNLDEIEKLDRQLIDSCLYVYHNSNEDTSRIKAIIDIVYKSWDNNVWPRYNDWIYHFVKKKLPLTRDSNEIHFLKETLSGAINNQGLYYFEYEVNYSLAIRYYEESRTLKEELKAFDELPPTLDNLASVFIELGDRKKGLEYYFKSLKMAEQLGKKSTISAALNNIGVFFNDQGENEKSLEYYERSLKISEDINDMDGIASALHNIAAVLESDGKIEESIKYYEKSLNISKRSNNKALICRTLNNIGYVYFKLKKYNESIVYFHKSIAISESLGNSYVVASTYINLGQVQLEQKKINGKNGAIFYAKKALEMGNKLGSTNILMDASKLLNTIYEQQKEYKKALEMYRMYISMRDSISNDEIKKSMFKQQAKYEYEKQKAIDDKEHERIIAIEREEKTHQSLLLERKDNDIKNRNYIIIIIFFIGVSLWFYFSRMRLRNKFKINLLQQKVLKSQVRPHFMFNVMNSIQTLIIQNKRTEANIYLANFSSLMRKNLESFSSNWISLEDEIELTTLYLDLEKLRFKEKLNYEINIDKNISQQEIQIPSMILQPLVENAVIHGIMPQESSGLIIIHITRKEKELIITIRDNGVGLIKKESSKGKHKSYGLKLTLDRLQFWNSKNHFSIYNYEDNGVSGAEVKLKIILK